MNSLIIKARLKLLLTTLFVIFFVTITTKTFSGNLIYQLSVFLFFILFYIFTSRERLKGFLDFTKFLLIIIIILHTIFFLFKGLSRGWDFAISFYKDRGLSIILRIFIIPNIFAFVNIMISRIGFTDIILISRNSIKAKAVYVLMISGVEVIERLRIHYEFHPLNVSQKGLQKVYHYLAVPLTLFFGISRGFENKYRQLLLREATFEENI